MRGVMRLSSSFSTVSATSVCFWRNSCRSPFSMYSIIRKDSSPPPSVQTPRRRTTLACLSLDMNFISLWKASLRDMSASCLNFLIATKTLQLLSVLSPNRSSFRLSLVVAASTTRPKWPTPKSWISTTFCLEISMGSSDLLSARGES